MAPRYQILIVHVAIPSPALTAVRDAHIGSDLAILIVRASATSRFTSLQFVAEDALGRQLWIQFTYALIIV